MVTYIVIGAVLLVTHAAAFAFGCGFARRNLNTVETVVEAGKTVGNLAK